MRIKSYKRISAEEREEISRYLATGESFRSIARLLGRPVSTITREVHTAGVDRWTYRAGRAQRRAWRNARKRREGKLKIKRQPYLRKYVETMIRQRWSPEQIAKRIKIAYPTDMDMRISHEAIYAYVYVLPKGNLKKELLKCLRRSHKRRYRGHKGVVSRPLKDMVSIEQRPIDIETRQIPGHWEGDLIIGRNRQSTLGTLIERKSRFALLVKVRSKDAEEIRTRFARKFKRLPKHARLSLTYDQGREMAQHALLAKQADVQVYFAHKACPWERGTNENFNGLVRQFFPKGTDFKNVSDYQINRVQGMPNGRPRKVLNWETPFEVFEKVLR